MNKLVKLASVVDGNQKAPGPQANTLHTSPIVNGFELSRTDILKNIFLILKIFFFK